MILDITFEENKSEIDVGLDPTTEYASKLLEKVKADNDETEAAIKEAAEMVVDAAERVEKVSVDKGTVANALKATASGEVVRVDDVSPIEHTVKVKVSGKNLIPYPYRDSETSGNGAAFTVQTDGGILARGTPTGYMYLSVYNGVPLLKNGIITLSLGGTYENVGADLSIYDNSKNVLAQLNIYPSKPAATINLDDYPNASGWNLSVKRAVNDIEMNGVVYPQIELGDTATEYEPYIDPTTVTVTRYGTDENDNPQTYTPSADGTCEIDSLSPAMTLITDTPGVKIDLEYNQDTNKAMDAVHTDLQELDRVTAEIIANIGDVETLLGGI